MSSLTITQKPDSLMSLEENGICHNHRLTPKRLAQYYAHQNISSVTNEKEKRSEGCHVIKGYIMLTCVAALMATLSILLLHAMTSIWLDPLRNLKLNEEFVYITVTLTASSVALNLTSLAIYSIQIYLVCSDSKYTDERKLYYFREVSVVRFVATFSTFISIPLFMASLCCYLYMEFTHISALIAISILSVAALFISYSFAYSYYKWHQLQNSLQNYRAYRELQDIVLNPQINWTSSPIKNHQNQNENAELRACRSPSNGCECAKYRHQEMQLPKCEDDLRVNSNHSALISYVENKKNNKNLEDKSCENTEKIETKLEVKPKAAKRKRSPSKKEIATVSKNCLETRVSEETKLNKSVSSQTSSELSTLV